MKRTSNHSEQGLFREEVLSFIPEKAKAFSLLFVPERHKAVLMAIMPHYASEWRLVYNSK